MYPHCKMYSFYPTSPDCFDLSNNNQGFDPFCFLGVHTVRGDKWKSVSFRDIPLENSVPLPAVFTLLHDNTKVGDFLLFFRSRLLLKVIFPNL